MPHIGFKFKIMLILQSSHHLSISGPDDFLPQNAKLLFQVEKKFEKGWVLRQQCHKQKKKKNYKSYRRVTF